MGEGMIIDASGREITRFDTVEPESYDETLYFGFQCQRVTVDADSLSQQRQELDARKGKIELSKYEAKLEKMEGELGRKGQPLSEDLVDDMLRKAKAKKSSGANLRKLIAKIEDDPDLDEEEKEELIEQLIARST